MDIGERIHTFFKNRIAVLATMHQKERVISPILEDKLGIKIIISHNLNTDSFGTFSGEIERQGNQLEAARHKAKEAMALTNTSLAISSEGLFGPHPIIQFVPFNREIVMLIDEDNELELVGVCESTETNYNEREVKSFEEAYEFALKVGFPEHGVIIRTKNLKGTSRIIKGITSKTELKDRFLEISKEFPDNEIVIETDMRAMFNPTRMKNIQAATLDLVKKIYSICPKCNFLGFEITEIKKGLPCGWCGLPTELVLSEVYSCKKCGEFEERKRIGASEADPSQCGFCNP